MSRVYDNWERLVAATLKREQFRQLCLAPSRESSFSSTPSSSFSFNSSPLHDSVLNFGSHGDASKILSEPGSSSASSSSRFDNDLLSSPNAKPIPLYELKRATKNFHQHGILGDGEYGPVYKGWIHEPFLPGSMAVAIKKLDPANFGLHSKSEWIREVEVLGQICHPNLVKLVGYYIDNENKFLVYKFRQKGSLDNHLFSRKIPPLSWDTRVKIAIGAARGLSFLHEAEPPVIHPNFTSSSILLDEDFSAKLSGFGLAKLRLPMVRLIPGKIYVDELDFPDPHITRDHAAPEHVATGKISTECDVYSFGIVLLELFSGRRAFEPVQVFGQRRIQDWAMPYLRDVRRYNRIMDLRLEGEYPRQGARKIAAIAALCLLYNAEDRPSMRLVVTALERLQAPGKIPDRKS